MTQDSRPPANPRSDAPRRRTPVAPAVKDRVRAVLTDKLASFLRAEDAAIDPLRPLAEYGIDSTDLLTLVFEIEEEFDSRFPPDTFFDIETLDDLAECIAASLVEQGKAPPAVPVAAPR